jgi:hypothetical protein
MSMCMYGLGYRTGDGDRGGVGLGIQVSLRDTSKLKDDFLMS